MDEPLAILDVIDGIVDDTHPEADGCPLCSALIELRESLGARQAATREALSVERLAAVLDSVLPPLRGETVACEHGPNDYRYWPVEEAPSDYAAAVLAALMADASDELLPDGRRYCSICYVSVLPQNWDNHTRGASHAVRDALMADEAQEGE